MIYSHDQPYNAFPSIHVLTTFAVMLGNINIKDKHPFHKMFVPVMGSLIIVSTLFVKQHFILDMISSVFLTSFIYGIMFELYGLSVKKQAYVERDEGSFSLKKSERFATFLKVACVRIFALMAGQCL